MYVYKRSAIKMNVNVRFVANEPSRNFFQEKGVEKDVKASPPATLIS